jgi:hypothetical protein
MSDLPDFEARIPKSDLPDLEALIQKIDEKTEPGTGLDRLAAAVEMNKALADLGDRLISHYVEGARAKERSWTEIGDVLGVSKQGAQQRFGRRFVPASLRREMRRMSRKTDPMSGNMFERFTDSAREVMVKAQDEARLLSHNYLGTEHLLLGLLSAEGKALGVLNGLGISSVGVRAEVDSIIGKGTAPAAGPPPFTPRAKKVIELAFRESLRLGDHHVASEHVLLGLLREGEGVAAQILKKLKVSEEQIQNVLKGMTEWGRPGDTRAQSQD